MRIEESLNGTFDVSLTKPKSFPSVKDDRIIEHVVQNSVRSPSLEVNASELGYPKSLIEARGHLIEQVIYELNERTLRSYETKDFKKIKFYRRISCCNDLLIGGALIQNTILKPEFHSKGTPS
ncbi:hypothetical protein Tco_0647637 [Tanacetum coccineum]